MRFWESFNIQNLQNAPNFIGWVRSNQAPDFTQGSGGQYKCKGKVCCQGPWTCRGQTCHGDMVTEMFWTSQPPTPKCARPNWGSGMEVWANLTTLFWENFIKQKMLSTPELVVQGQFKWSVTVITESAVHPIGL